MIEAAEEVDAILADPAFPRLKAHVVESTGLAYFEPREADLAARVHRRMTATHSPDCARYLSLILPPGSAEQEALIRELTIGETHFFRFREQFEALRRHVLPELIRQKQQARRLRIWSAGCATGPEPCSLAILLQREFGGSLADWHVTILGTDINQEFLQRAREGVYAEWALRGLPDDLRRECFTETPCGWRLADLYRQWLSFQRHNLVTDPVPPAGAGGDFDLVLCRNVMIYFSTETIRGVLANLHSALQPNGWLLVGHAEGNQEWFQGFEEVPMPGTVLYRRKHPERAQAATAITPMPAPGRAADRFQAGTAAAVGILGQMGTWRPHPLDEAPVAAPGPPTSGCAQSDPVGSLRALVNRGDWQAAEESSGRLLESDPLNALAHFYRGLALSHQGDLAGSEAALRRAIYLESDLSIAYYHLGLLLAAQGDRSGASKAFRNTLRALHATADETILDGEDLTAARLREAVESQVRSLAA